LNSAVATGFGFRKGWRNERELFFSGEAFALMDGDFGDGDGCDAAAPPLPTCEAEALEVWLTEPVEPEPPE